MKSRRTCTSEKAARAGDGERDARDSSHSRVSNALELWRFREVSSKEGVPPHEPELEKLIEGEVKSGQYAESGESLDKTVYHYVMQLGVSQREV